VVYKEGEEGFIITAFMTSKNLSLEKKALATFFARKNLY
jgi:hypothetical protein